LCCGFAVAPAFAEAKLVQSSPAADAKIAAPKILKLTFSEKIAPALSGVTLSMSHGMAVSTKSSLSDDGKTITARPTSPFMSGQWTLSWHATSAEDGGKSEGSLAFTVK
jgi:hypothetical protein